MSRAREALRGVALLLLLAACSRPATPSTASSPPPAVDAGPPPSFVLLATGDVAGALEPCACGEHPLGGRARWAGLVEASRAAGERPVVLDLGGSLTPPDGGLDGLPTHLAVLGLGPLDALLVGAEELAAGLGPLQALAADAGVPLLGGGWQFVDGGAPFPSTLSVKRPAGELVLIGAVLTGGSPGLQRVDPAPMPPTPAGVARIALLRGSPDQAARWLATQPPFDLVLLSGAGLPGRRSSSPPTYGLAREGKSLQRLVFAPGPAPLRDVAEQEEFAQQLAQAQRQAAETRARIEQATEELAKAALRERAAHHEARAAELAEELGRLRTARPLEARVVPLDGSTPESKAARARLNLH